MASSEAIIELRELIGDDRVAMITTRTPSGELHGRPSRLAEIGDGAELLFIVDSDADWVRGLSLDESVNVSFADEDDKTWVSVSGRSRVIDDPAAVHRLWVPQVELFFPDGPTSPNVRLLSVAASSAEYWDAPSGRVKRLAVMATAFVGNRTAKLGTAGTIDLD